MKQHHKKQKTSLTKKRDERFEMRFQAKKKYILKSLDLKSKMWEIFFQKKVNLLMVDES